MKAFKEGLLRMSIPLLLMLFPFSGIAFAAPDLPVAYWELVNEDRYTYRFDMEKLHWREIRERRAMNKTANTEIKTSELKLLDLKRWQTQQGGMENLIAEPACIMRDPNGAIHRLTSAEGHVAVKIPADANLIGRYLLGAQYRFGDIDVDGDGKMETVSLSAKQIITHYRNGGKQGSASVVFIDNAEYLPLEIGPVINTAENQYGGGTHRPHREYTFMVKYMNRPLAGATVRLYTMGSHWEKAFVTDEEGEFTVTPTDDRTDDGKEYQKYLYVAYHHDQKKGTYHISSLPVIVYRNRPEWYSKAMGFTLFSIAGTAVVAGIVLGVVARSRRRENRRLVVFDQYRIKEEP
jgi:hypothetical protein